MPQSQRQTAEQLLDSGTPQFVGGIDVETD